MYGQNVFTGVIDDNGVIWDFVGGRKNVQVGIDAQKEKELLLEIDELKEITDNYYNKLVELGVITPPKTAEEIANEQINIIQTKLNEQSEINSTLLDTLKKMNAEIASLKERDVNNGHVGHDNKQSGTDTGKKPARHKKSD